MSLSIKSFRAIRPLADRILVQKIKPAEKTASGIFIPTANAQAPPEGQVLAVGPGGRNEDGKVIPVSVQEGDRVLLPAFGGQTFKVGDDEYHLFRDAELLAKLSE